jgi:hypothetical protein
MEICAPELVQRHIFFRRSLFHQSHAGPEPDTEPDRVVGDSSANSGTDSRADCVADFFADSGTDSSAYF